MALPWLRRIQTCVNYTQVVYIFTENIMDLVRFGSPGQFVSDSRWHRTSSYRLLHSQAQRRNAIYSCNHKRRSWSLCTLELCRVRICYFTGILLAVVGLGRQSYWPPSFCINRMVSFPKVSRWWKEHDRRIYYIKVLGATTSRQFGRLIYPKR